MPLADFTPEHHITKTTSYAKLKLTTGEMKRIVCLEKPFYAWTHTLRAPKIVDGRAIIVEKARKDGSKYKDFDMDYIGRPICLGDEGIIKDKGRDVKACPVCEMSQSTDWVQAPERRFAMNVAIYNTRAGSFDVTKPFGVSIAVWPFTEKVYLKLYDFAQWDGGLQAHDLQLGPCKSADYQNFDIALSQRAEWAADAERKKHTVEAFKENRVDDLESACGRRVDKKFILEDLDRIRQRWRTANNDGPSYDDTLAGGSLADGLDDLLSAQTGAATSGDLWDNASGSSLDLGALLDEEMSIPGKSSDRKPGSSGETLDFSTLLKD